MEAIAMHASIRELPRNAKAWASAGCVRWKAVSKHAIWGRSGAVSATARIAASLMGLVKWGKGNQALELLHHRLVDAHGRAVERSAVHHAMAHGGKPGDAAMIAEPRPDPCDRSAMIAGLRGERGSSVCTGRSCRRQRGALRVDRSPRPGPRRANATRLAVVAREERKLEARGSGVQDEDRAAHLVILIDARANGSQGDGGLPPRFTLRHVDRPGSLRGPVADGPLAMVDTADRSREGRSRDAAPREGPDGTRLPPLPPVCGRWMQLGGTSPDPALWPDCGGVAASRRTNSESYLATYASVFQGTITVAADTIRGNTRDPEIRRRTLLWKLRISPVAYETALLPDPLQSYVLLFALAASQAELPLHGGRRSALWQGPGDCHRGRGRS